MTQASFGSPLRSARPDRAVPSVAGSNRPGSLWDPALLALLAIGAALRLSVISRIPFEQDEIYTIIESEYLWNSPLNPGIHARPLYYLLQHPLLDLLGTSHVALRVLPFLFGMAGLWVTWLLAARIGGRAAAIIATLLAATAPWHLHASGMARYWALVYLLFALFLYFLFRAGDSGKAKDARFALLPLLLGVASHPTFLFPVVGTVLGFHLVRDDGRLGIRLPDRRMLLNLWGPAAIGIGVFYIFLTASGGEGDSPIRNWDGRGLAASLRLLPAIVEWATPAILLAGATGAVALLASPAASPAQRRWSVTATLGVLSCLGALFAASFSTDVYADYAIYALPFVFVSIGAAVQTVVDRLGGQGTGIALATGLVLAAATVPGMVSYLSDGMRFDYRPSFRAIESTDPRPAVLTFPIAFQRLYAPDLRGIETPFDRPSLDRILADEGSIWTIIPLRRYGIWQDVDGELERWVRDNCRFFSATEKPRFDYRRYRAELYRCGA